MKKITRILSIFWIFSFLLVQTVYGAELSDISNNENQTAIQYLYDNGVISGYPDGTFKPNNTLNRAELLKILVGGKNIQPTLEEGYKNCFPDVKEEWFAPFVCYAKIQGWVGGYPDGTFQPAKTVNKVEAMKMFVNSQEYSIPTNIKTMTFTDIDINQWYAPFLKVAQEKGLLEESGSIYGVNNEMSRAAISENIYRAMIITKSGETVFTKANEEELNTSTGYLTETENNDLFPINLINNEKWEIEIRPFDDLLGYDKYFYKIKRQVKRYAVITDKIDLTLMKTDKITGLEQEVSEHPTYGKFFVFLSGDNLTIMSELDCTYEYIATDCHRYTLKIPSKIIEEYTIGKETYSGNSNGYSSSTFDQDTKIKLLGKNITERTCNVRGIEHSPYNVYYTADSTEFNKISRYICFESEDEAISKDYIIAANN